MGFLTDLKIRTLSPSAKEQMLNDGDGLSLPVRASRKSWLYRYKSGEKQMAYRRHVVATTPPSPTHSYWVSF